jgi:aspartyl aminopeptidase
MFSYTYPSLCQALINSVESTENLAADSNIRVAALFDNEEVGSETAQGAGSNLLEVSLKRLAEADLVDGITKLSPVSKLHSKFCREVSFTQPP